MNRIARRSLLALLLTACAWGTAAAAPLGEITAFLKGYDAAFGAKDHPHPDRRTGAQVYGGMAGFFIVEDEDERALGLPAGLQDVPLLLRDRRRTAGGSFRYAPTPMDLMAGYLGDAALVNGTPDAEISVAATLHRLRLLNVMDVRMPPFDGAFTINGRSFDPGRGSSGVRSRCGRSSTPPASLTRSTCTPPSSRS
jgi:hypothetical protein